MFLLIDYLSAHQFPFWPISLFSWTTNHRALKASVPFLGGALSCFVIYCHLLAVSSIRLYFYEISLHNTFSTFLNILSFSTFSLRREPVHTSLAFTHAPEVSDLIVSWSICIIMFVWDGEISWQAHNTSLIKHNMIGIPHIMYSIS